MGHSGHCGTHGSSVQSRGPGTEGTQGLFPVGPAYWVGSFGATFVMFTFHLCLSGVGSSEVVCIVVLSNNTVARLIFGR